MLYLLGTVDNLACQTEYVRFLINLLHCLKGSWPWVLGMPIKSVEVQFSELPIALEVLVWKEVTLTHVVVSVQHRLVGKEEHLWVFEQSFWKSHTNLESCISLREA